jgi:hypothetical protein
VIADNHDTLERGGRSDKAGRNGTMLNRDRAHEIFERIRNLSSADEVELIVSGGRSALTRFANNAITQNVAEENYEASLRVAFDGRTARAWLSR